MTLSFNQPNNQIGALVKSNTPNNPFSPNFNAQKAQQALHQHAHQKAAQSPQSQQLAAFAKGFNAGQKTAASGFDNLVPMSVIPAPMPMNASMGAIPASSTLNSFMDNPYAMAGFEDILAGLEEGPSAKEIAEAITEEMKIQQKVEKYEKKVEAWKKVSEAKVEQLLKTDPAIKEIHKKLAEKKRQHEEFTKEQKAIRERYEKAGLDPVNDNPKVLQAQIDKVMAKMAKGDIGANQLLNLMSKLAMVKSIDPNNEWDKVCEKISKNEGEQAALRDARLNVLCEKVANPPEPDPEIADRVKPPSKEGFVQGVVDKHQEKPWY